MANELKKMVGEKEEIIYEGKPYKNALYSKEFLIRYFFL